MTDIENHSENINNTKVRSPSPDTTDSKELKNQVKPHPLGIKPLGNIYIDQFKTDFQPRVRERGLGYFRLFEDSFILDLLNLLNPRDLFNLMQTSKVFYTFCSSEELWKHQVIENFNGHFDFQLKWKNTFKSKCISEPNENSCNIQIQNFYSDLLYQPWLCTVTPLESFKLRNNIPKRSNLSLAEFIDEYETPNLPVIITDVVTKWPAYAKWDEKYLRDNFGEVPFRAEAIDITLNRYFDYANSNQDESPIYLFDKKFGENCPSMLDDFSVPEYFQEDLFGLLGDERPDYRWIIIGPKRSGSTFHKDPNSTSAWNAVIRGKKRWILFPPNITPPGVFTNSDESEVTSPVSIMEWFINFHKLCKRYDPPPLEGVCDEGEIIFVPNGWWHLVVNLEDSIALTQNYVSSQNVSNVLKFLKDKGDQVSGCKLGESLFDQFCNVYESKDKELVDKMRQSKENQNAKSSWENLTEEAHQGSNFSFGFQF